MTAEPMTAERLAELLTEGPLRITATWFGKSTIVADDGPDTTILNIHTAHGTIDIDLGTEFAEPMGLLLLDCPQHSDGYVEGES